MSGERSPVVLVGPTASGKTVVGRALARLLGRPFIDADDLVAARAGATVAEIFAGCGEAEFRHRERLAVREILGLGAVVAALGGGAVLDAGTRARLAAGCRVAVLDADTATLLARLRARPRPALGARGGEPELMRLIETRREACRGLGPTIQAGQDPPEAVAAKMAGALGLKPMSPAAGAGGGGDGPRRAGAVLWRLEPWQTSVDLGRVRSRLMGRPFALACLAEPGAGEVAAALGEAAGVGEEVRAGGAGGRRPRALVVSSPLPWALFGRALCALLERAGLEPAGPSLVPDGERAKSAAWLRQLWREWAGLHAERRDIVVALGGGATSDLAGLAAATYLRGLGWAAFPTTLLAQADAAMGGKVAINLPQGKNLVGAFHQPRLVAVDPAALASLPRRRLADGLAEVVKCALIAGGRLWELVEKETAALGAGDLGTLHQAVRLCLELKAGVVASDEREAGPREVLNLGHTVGHALEAAARWPHGRAVAVGLVAACRLAGAGGLAGRVAALLGAWGLPSRLPPRLLPAVMDGLAWDKKSRGGELRFVLPQTPGRVKTGVVVAPEAVAAALAAVPDRDRTQ